MIIAAAQLRHCAIYTRKSSDEGLAQDFNSLQAHGEACADFIQSQQGEGWRLSRLELTRFRRQYWG